MHGVLQCPVTFVLLTRTGRLTARQTLVETAEEEDQLALMNLSALCRRPQLYRYPLAQEILAQHDPIEVGAVSAVRPLISTQSWH
jgi:hypothetical protein